MNTEALKFYKTLLAEAFVDELTSHPGWDAAGKHIDQVADFITKMEVLSAIGLSRFWSSERIAHYQEQSTRPMSLSMFGVVDMLISIQHRFIGKLALTGVCGATFIFDYVAEVLKGCIRSDGVAVRSKAIIPAAMVTHLSISPDLFDDKRRENFITANLWLGVLHMAISSGAVLEIINEIKKGN